MALAWVLARRRFPRQGGRRGARVAAARHAAGRDRPRPAVAARAARARRTPARAARDRNRLHAARPSSSRWRSWGCRCSCARRDAGFEQVTRRYEQIAETLGAGPWRVFATITLPLAARNILAGALLGFSRALGEFGATIVVAGSIPGRTRTLAVGIYSFAETGQDTAAAILVAISVAIGFGAVLISNLLLPAEAGSYK